MLDCAPVAVPVSERGHSASSAGRPTESRKVGKRWENDGKTMGELVSNQENGIF
jgi:hypothetical protein